MLKQKGRNVNANKCLPAFLFAFIDRVSFMQGICMLKLFQVDIASFAVAGALLFFSCLWK